MFYFIFQLVNKEMYWVITEVCSEPNVVKRMRIIKQFIKIASKYPEIHLFNINESLTVLLFLEDWLICLANRFIVTLFCFSEHCKDCKNFNSMFSILSGLDKVYVSRLRNTWEKLSKKDLKTYDVCNAYNVLYVSWSLVFDCDITVSKES